MALNYILVAFFLIAFIVGIARLLLFHDTAVFSNMMDSTFKMAETSVNISIYLIGVMTLWMGIMKIGESGGAIGLLSKLTGPFFSKLFPEVPKDHPANGAMLMNFASNMLGLDNAATPLGLEAMNKLQQLNPEKDRASNAQIMFLVLNTSGLTVIPVSVMAIRAAQGAANPADIFIPILLATFCSTLVGLITVSIFQKINLFNKVILTYLGVIILLITGMIFFFMSLPQEKISAYSGSMANLLLFSIIISFIVLAVRNRTNVYESFIEGAKDGFNTAIRIIPFLVAMLVAIGVFRASGTLDILVDGLRWLFSSFLHDTRFVDALPTAFMKPLSGSGARGMMVETMQTFGADSFAGHLSSTFQGSTETTFYTLAVYYGAVKIRKTRYTLTCGLIADLAGIIASIFIAYLFFGGK